ncbi:MAG: flavin oxidoreductase/NADH oxidase [Clostridiales bacterium]|jgi:2,4-dienoyl-CoA reductase-like NADH-dependent reductase (Old Yellow Enzyme family)|nr:flavin oxidoreductase/NADH oxidase [Clostridiales bacterium]
MFEKKLADTICVSKSGDILNSPVKVGNVTINNRIVIQPMEGCDGTKSGAPDELTNRRYNRFAESGAGIIWFEAVAVEERGRSNPRQLWLTEENKDHYKRLIFDIKSRALSTTGVLPVLIMQATHSGRYSKPKGVPEPIIACNNPIIEMDKPLSPDRIITDDGIKRIEESYAEAVKLAEEVGFDGIDIKCCHGYLNNELLSAYTRKGEYGGSYENRTRFFRNCVNIAKSYTNSDFIITSRLNIYDHIPYPYGWGMNKEDVNPDLSEPLRLIEDINLDLLNITMGNPYYNPQVNRPVDMSAVKRMFELTKRVQDAFPEKKIILSAVTYLRENAGYYAAKAIEEGYCTMAGFGRMSIAYPKFAQDMLNGGLDSRKVCITCGKCTELMRCGSVTGCVIRDKYYTDLYKEVMTRCV